MLIVLIAFYAILSVIIFFFCIVIILQGVYKYSEVKTENNRKKYRELIMAFCMSDKSDDEKTEKHLRNAVRMIDDDFIFVAINVINEFEGDFRRKLILFLDKSGASDYVYKKLTKTKRQSYRRLYTFEIGEIRSRRHFTYLLGWTNEYILEHNLYSPYVFALHTILNEWINDESETNIKKFINKIFEIISVVETQEKWNVKRIIEYLLNDSSNLFNYFLRNESMRQYFYMKLAEDNTTLKTKGEIIYLLAFNQEYDIIDLITMEFFKYCDIEDKTNDELEYLINLTKSAGLIEMDESLRVLYRAAVDTNWVIRSQCAKYLSKHSENEIKDILYKFLFDSNWWVRINAADGLKNFGEEGYFYLFQALNSNDKYAREVAAFGLTNSEYTSRCISIINENGFSYLSKEILLIINNANNINLLDELIIAKSISNKDKIKLIEGVKTKKFLEYFNNAMKFRKLDTDIYTAAEKRISEIFLEGDDDEI